MDRTERFYKIDRLLRQNPFVPIGRFLDELEVSRATFKRDIEYMRSRLHAPIVWDRERNGYCFEAKDDEAKRYELPGIWFNASEVYALLAMEQLLEQMQPGILAPRLAPLRARLAQLLGSADDTPEEVRQRIRVLPIASRTLPAGEFEMIAHALLKRRRVAFTYQARTTNDVTTRTVSPQRLVHYRDNWYLDAWCHMRKGLRSFSVDCIRDSEVVDEAAIDVPAEELDKVLGSGYGIFSGQHVQWAMLRFTERAARWVSAETWHPDQKSRADGEGRYVLEIPYSDDRELIMDILRHGADVEVLAPEELRGKVQEALLTAARQYGSGAET
ncbi:MAG: helix-turn-helix transcriptional regulator [Rhodospirillaceae bacterium]